MLLILYSAKRKGKGRELRSEDEEDAARRGDDTQSAGARPAVHHW
jgi:hypothetical protein